MFEDSCYVGGATPLEGRTGGFLFQFSNTPGCFVLEIAILTPHLARSQLKVGKSVADGHIVFDGDDKLSDEDAHRKMQGLKRKKWTATMKRRALKPNSTK